MVLTDPVNLEIAWWRLISIADEMAASLRSAAFSSVVREANDFACAILTPAGELLVEYSRSVPVFTNVLTGAAQSILRELADALEPGDVVLTNDPWFGNTHLSDFIALTPVWGDGRIVAHTVSICHVADVGGASEGAFARDIYEEGICIPPMRFRRGGALDDTIVRILERNVRVPHLVLGDLHALMAANDFGAERLTDYLGRFEDEHALEEIAAAIAETSESAMRSAITAIPDGTYTGEVALDGFEEPKVIHVEVAVAGNTMRVDFSRTSEQSTFGINSGAPSVAYTLYSLKCILTPDVPNNAWTYRPIEVEIPLGTLLNPRPPAPLSANFPSHLIQAALYGALHEVDPGAVMAPSGAPMWVVALRGAAADGPFAATLCFNGGQGALRGKDGVACLSMPSNVGNTPIETTEAEIPVLYEEKSVARGTGGRGAWNGGDGQRVVLRSVHHADLDVVFLTERLKHPAQGLAGGTAGDVGELLLDGEPVVSPKGRARLSPGSTLTLRTPGGGGFGDIGARGVAPKYQPEGAR